MSGIVSDAQEHLIREYARMRRGEITWEEYVAERERTLDRIEAGFRGEVPSRAVPPPSLDR